VLATKRTEPSAVYADVLTVFDVDSRKVPFSKVYACFPLSLRFVFLINFVLGAKFILVAVPADLDALWFSA
jgi:hypothetical protein